MAKQAQTSKIPSFSYTLSEGKHVYAFPDAPLADVSIVIEEPEVDAFKRLMATVTACIGTLELPPARLNLLVPQNLVDFASVVATFDGKIPWYPYLAHIVPHLRHLLQQQAADAAQPTPEVPGPAPVDVTMSDVQAEPVDWLWHPYFARKKVSMVDGDPGTGKTLLITQIAASLSRGYSLPDQQGTMSIPTYGPQTTLMLSAEDGLADTLKPRLEAAGADTTKVHVLTGWRMSSDDDEVQPFTLQHMPILEEALERYRPALVVIDPIQAYLGDIDMHRANETRPLLAKLTRLAERYNCAIVCIRHPAKPGQGGGKAIHRGLGSVDFIGAARTALYVEQHPTDASKVLLAQTKSNLGPLGRTQVFTKYEGRFEWCGISRISAEMLAGSGRGPDPQAFLEAVFWLEEALKSGVPKSCDTIQEDAEKESISWRTLQRAKKALGVRSTKLTDQWYWGLPPLPVILPPPSPKTSPNTPTTSTTQLGSLDSLGSLGGLQSNQLDSGNRGEDDHARQENQEDQGRLESQYVYRGPLPPTKICACGGTDIGEMNGKDVCMDCLIAGRGIGNVSLGEVGQ